MTFQSTQSFNWNSFPKSFCQHNTFTNKKKLLHSQNYSPSQRDMTVKTKGLIITKDSLCPTNIGLEITAFKIKQD